MFKLAVLCALIVVAVASPVPAPSGIGLGGIGLGGIGLGGIGLGGLGVVGVPAVASHTTVVRGGAIGLPLGGVIAGPGLIGKGIGHGLLI